MTYRPEKQARRPDVTIREIARQAGVSIATVSRVMNEIDHPVSEATRKRVQDTIQRLHYSTNIYGKGLAGKSNVIGLFIGAPLSVDPGFAVSVARVIDGIKAIARNRAYHVFLEVDDRPADGEVASSFLAGIRLAGAVMVAPRHDNPVIPQLAESQTPTIVIGARSFPDCHFVDSNNTYAGRRAVQHFSRLGRRRIAHLGGPVDFSPSLDMLRGLREELERIGLTFRRDWYAAPDSTIEGGKVAALRILALPERPDAVFAFTDALALGALQAAQELNINVPDELSIVGYDDFPIAASVHPQLTTFRHPDHEMASQAIRWLIDEIIPGKIGTGRLEALFKPKLIIRESCGARMLSETTESV